MTQTLQTLKDAERTLPLVRAIVREVRERTRQVEALEARLTTGESGPELESELSSHRRELRTCERELARLGFGIDADDPHRIVGQGASFKFDDTQFYRAASSKG
ncbi:MAG: DUF2203 family protein [Planctomycetes bacterium]|jgi:hypothetical protein|nr:DUF2203 family protein [Planctomycetota bacterium]